MAEIVFADADQFAVPDRFVMICNASGVPNANLAPIYHLGRERIAALAINCGVMDHDNPTIEERQNAVEPAEWLKAFACRELGLGIDCVRLFEGDPDGIADWARTDADSAVGWATEFGLPVVANLQGGTTQMSVGLAQALSDSGADWMRCFLGKRPPLTYLPLRIGGEMTDLLVTSPAEIAPLDVLLDARGYVRFDDEKSRQRKRYMLDHAPAARKVLTQFLSAYMKQETRWPLMDARSALARQLEDRNEDAGYPYRLRVQEDWDVPFRNVLGEELWNDGLIESDAQRNFLAGGWLEQAIAERIEGWLSRQSGWRVDTGLAFRRKDGFDAMNEVDIVVGQQELCHLIEVKSGRYMDDIREWGDKLVKLNRILAGRPGKSWIVAPFGWIDNDAFRDEQVQRLAKSGVRVLMGPTALEDLRCEIEALF